MAKVYAPLRSEKASGKFGTQVATSWRGLSIMREKVSPKQPRTSRQLEVRSILTAVMQGYANLSTSQVSGWASLAKAKKRTDSVGNSYSIDAPNAYAMVNTIALDIGSSIGEDAPTTSPAATVESIVSAAPGTHLTGAVLTVTLIGTGAAVDYLDTWLAGPYKSPNRNATKSEYKHFSYTAGNVLAIPAVGLVEDMYYWAEVRYIDEYGQVTGFAKIQFQAIATP